MNGKWCFSSIPSGLDRRRGIYIAEYYIFTFTDDVSRGVWNFTLPLSLSLSLTVRIVGDLLSIVERRRRRRRQRNRVFPIVDDRWTGLGDIPEGGGGGWSIEQTERERERERESGWRHAGNRRWCLAAAWNSGKLANRGGCAAVLSQGRSRGSGCREEKGRKRSELADEPGRRVDKAREPGARKSKGSKRRTSWEGGDGKEEEGRELT